MTDAEKLEFVKALYPNRRWAQKVDRMTRQQVHSIWYRYKDGPPVKEKETEESPQDTLF